MKPETHVLVDVKALADLRARFQLDEAATSAVRSELDAARDEIQRLKEQEERLASAAQAEAERTGSELNEFERRQSELRRNVAELSEALQKAQAGYWEATQTLSEIRRELTLRGEELEEKEKSLARLQAQLQRIIDSRAWRQVTRYRRFVKWLRRHG